MEVAIISSFNVVSTKVASMINCNNVLTQNYENYDADNLSTLQLFMKNVTCIGYDFYEQP